MESVVKKYDIIYADPPWNFKVWSKKGNGRSAENHYPTQGINYLSQMNITAIANKDCVLFLWATFPSLLEALKLGEDWGFTYKTVAFTWIKNNKSGVGIFMGLGYYTRSNAELVLLFTKGKPLKRVAKNVRQVLIAPLMEHSRKPAAIRDLIVRLFGDVPRIELFARSRTGLFPDDEYMGWDVFGNEVNHSIILPD